MSAKKVQLNEIPDCNQELETKFLVGRVQDLKDILDNITQDTQICVPYADLIGESYWHKDLSNKGNHKAVVASPISAYIDDQNMTMRHNGNSLRSRFTRVHMPEGGIRISDHVQHCVKDDGHPLHGGCDASSARHEDEKYSQSKLIDFSLFSDPQTIEILQGVDEASLHLYFYTDVKRKMVAYMQEVNGKKALLEISFDKIKGKRPNLDEEGRPEVVERNGKRSSYLKTFYREDEIEIEYVHPINEQGQLTKLAKELNLSPLTMSEITHISNNMAERLHDDIDKINTSRDTNSPKIEIKSSGFSKGQRGFLQLESQRALNHCVPYARDDIEIFLPGNELV